MAATTAQLVQSSDAHIYFETLFVSTRLMALAEPTAHWLTFAFLFPVGLHGTPQTIELMKLRAEDVRLPQSEWEPRVIVPRLVEPKNKAYPGRYQFTTIDQPELVAWVE